MRAGGCTVQQALTTEAANVVKQAITLAKRRGHAQVTPLHVATTMLAPPTGLLRTACLQSHSHHLQCKALDVCINVALNRLPTASSTPILGPPQSSNLYPSISNALVAAFKRAQAHQRRGSVENQQQPLLAVKIELEQLIISILDDPSVSRVMREAGFSSTQVKINVEKAVSNLELLCSSQTTPPTKQGSEPIFVGRPPKASSSSDHQAVTMNEDIMSVIENMMSKRRKSIAIVGECIFSIEGVVKGLMEKVDRGEVPEGFREVNFISLPLSSLGNMCREEVEQKMVELRCLVKSCVEKGVVLYLGDLRWTNEKRVSSCDDDHQGRKLQYCPVEHMIVELGRLVCGFGERNERFWLMGIATFQTYRRCRSGHPSLEIVWGLHPVTIPEASLSLSLIPESDVQSASESKKSGNGSTWLQLDSGKEKQQPKCSSGECCEEFGTDASGSFRSSTCTSEATTSTLPSWLQQYKNQTRKHGNKNDQECVPVKDLCQKWNSSFCSSSHKQPYSNERTITFCSLSPSSSNTTGFSYDHQNPNFPRDSPMFEPKQYWSHGQHFSASEGSLRTYIINPEHKEPKQATTSSNPNSTSSGDDFIMEETANFQRFKEWNSENLKTLCTALEKKVPWQRDIIPEIASTILQCRSGMVRRKGKVTISSSELAKEETWLFFQGVDVDNAKEEIAKELARLVFGSSKDLVSISLSSFSSTRADSTEDLTINKRARDNQSYIERFAKAVGKNPRRVFLVEDVEQADYCSQMGIKRAIERGRISDSEGNEMSLCDAIIILSCESFSSRSRAPSPPVKQNSDGSEEDQKQTSPCGVSLDLNISFDDQDGEEDNESIDDIGLLESVDGRVFFKIQEL